MTEQTESKEIWALVELFGHQRIAGKVTQAEFGNGELIRIDVPAVKDREPATKYYSVKAIYGITPVTEATATKMAESIHVAPISEFSLERLIDKAAENRAAKGIPPSTDDDLDDDSEDIGL